MKETLSWHFGFINILKSIIHILWKTEEIQRLIFLIPLISQLSATT